MSYKPNKNELEILSFLHKLPRGDGGRKIYSSQRLESELRIDHSAFTEILIASPLLQNNDGMTWITLEGDTYISNHGYEKYKEVSYWIFGAAAVLAAVFATLTYFK